MRLWKCQCLLLTALLVNLVILYYFWKLQNSIDLLHEGRPSLVDSRPEWPYLDLTKSKNVAFPNNYFGQLPSVASKDPKEIAKILTVVVREFEFFENDLPETIQAFLQVLPTVKIVILADAYPYPPLQIPAEGGNVKVVVLHPRVEEPSFLSQPDRYIRTPFTLLVPDAIRITSTEVVEQMLRHLIANPDSLVAAKVAGMPIRCLKLDAKLREWTLEQRETHGFDCDAIQGPNVLLANTKQLFDLAEPFSRPFPDALFIQTAIRRRKVHVLDSAEFQPGRQLFLDNHLKWKHGTAGTERFKMLYEDFGIKKVVRSNGEVEWYGCSKTTARCFGTVVQDMPEYLFAKRWTPPCCLEGLRQTARHVFAKLKASGVRYWLEGGSLLGAARNGDIIPWDYDVDVGIYEADVEKCSLLQDSAKQAVVTEDGFVWEKATEGDFYRVQFSQSNHLHVDIFPFFPREGIMTKRTWFKTHRQDVEFPEHYLRPLTTVRFIGMEAAAPNNIREFLELKFGEGVIENLQYPDPKILPFPNISSTRS